MTEAKQIEKSAAAFFNNVVRHRELYRHLRELERFAEDPALTPGVKAPLRDALSSLLAATLAQRAHTAATRPDCAAVTERMREAG